MDLRDIKARRLKLSPVSDADLSALIDLGLVEMRDDAPVLQMPVMPRWIDGTTLKRDT